MFPVKHFHHGLLFDSHHGAIRHCGRRAQAERLRSSHAVHFSSVSRLSSPSGLHCERLRCPDHISDRSLRGRKLKDGPSNGSGRNAGSGVLIRVLLPVCRRRRIEDGRFELGPPFDPRNRECSLNRHAQPWSTTLPRSLRARPPAGATSRSTGPSGRATRNAGRTPRCVRVPAQRCGRRA